MGKKTLVALVSATVIFSLVMAGCGGNTKAPEGSGKTAEQAAPAKKVKVAYYGSTCEAPTYIAFEKGIFKKKGLDVELVKVNFETLKEGIATGKVDFVQVTAGELKPIEQGLDIKITSGVHTGCIQTVVPVNSSIKSPADLKEKTIGVEAIGGVPMSLLSIELGRLGVNPKTGVTWKAFPGPQLVQALEKGEIDAFATWDPFGQLAINEGKVRHIFSNTHTAQYKDHYCCFVGINGKVSKEKPEVARSITEALQEAGQWIEENPKEAAKIVIDKKYTDGDLETSGTLLTEYTFKSDTTQAKESLAFFLKGLKDQQILDSSTDPDQLLQSIFVDVSK